VPVPRLASTLARRSVVVSAVLTTGALIAVGVVISTRSGEEGRNAGATVPPSATTAATSTTPAAGDGEGVFGMTLSGHTAQIGPQFFGMTSHHNGDPDIASGAQRLWDTGTTWRDVEPGDGVWRFGVLDSRVDAARKRGDEVLLTLGLTPTWASSRPTEETPAYGEGATSPPEDLDDWRTYVRTVATRYAGRIAQYEIWNEPDSPIFWHGTNAQFIELTVTAAEEIRRADPAAKVFLGGTNIVKTGYTATLLDAFFSAGGGASVDGVCLHLYPGKGTTVIDHAAAVENVRKVLARWQESDLPMWMCEAGYPSPGENTAYTGDEALALVGRSALESAYLGLARQYWYAWDNRGFIGVYLVEEDLKTPTDAARAYDQVYSWMSGSRFVGCAVDRSQADTEVWACRLQRGDGSAWVLWRVGAEATVTVPPGTVRTETVLGEVGDTAPGRDLDVPTVPLLLTTETWPAA
jgi:polysaccharide biosynthesis protein PslG